MPKRAFHRNCLTGWGGWPHSSKTQFSEKLVFERTCASTSKHFLHPIFFFFNLRGEYSSHSERTLGKLLLGSPAAPNISLRHYANAALVFPQSGEGPNPSFPQHPTAPYSLGSATTEDCSICLYFSSDLGFASFCHWMYLLLLCASESFSAPVFKCN